MKRLYAVILTFLVLLPCSVSHAQELALRAYVNRTSLRVNQQFELNVELSGADAQRAPEPEVPNLDDFASYVGSSTSTSMQIVNGQMSVSRTLTHIYVATTEGKFQIPPITVEYRGETYQSDPIDIEIGKGQASAPPAGSGSRNSPTDTRQLSDQLFFRAEVDEKHPYQNQQVTVTYKIYTLVNVTNYGVSQLPNTVGFWTEEFEMPQRIQSYEDIINGRRYRVYEIKKMAL
ncbi:MAG: BatD family protein, partial [bacterium]